MKSKRHDLAILDREDMNETRLFWTMRSAEDRLSAVEFLREHFYITQGYKRVPSIVFKYNIVER